MRDDRPRIPDPYTGDDCGPAEPGRIVGPMPDDGYTGEKPNPVYRGLPYATLVIAPDGEIAAVQIKGGGQVSPDEHDARRREIYKRTRRKSDDGIGSGGAVLESRPPCRLCGRSVALRKRAGKAGVREHRKHRCPHGRDCPGGHRGAIGQAVTVRCVECRPIAASMAGALGVVDLMAALKASLLGPDASLSNVTRRD